MSERIVSPGVFTRERDLSFLPQGISEIGAAIIGPTPKGPAFTPTQVSNFQEFEEIFGNLNPKFYVPYTVEAYLRSAGTVTVVRVLGIGGYKADSIELRLQATSSIAQNVTRSLAVLAPSLGGNSTGDLSESVLSGAAVGLSGSFTLIASGSDITSATYSLSFNTGSANYIENVISKDPLSTKSGNNTSPVYIYKIYKEAIHRTFGGDLAKVTSSINVTNDGFDFQGGTNTVDSNGDASDTTWTGNKDFQNGRTPYIESQLINGTRYKLFRIYTQSHGTDINNSLKIAVLNIRPASDVAGSNFGTFSIQVRVHNPDKTDDDNILEQYDNLTLDPESPNFIGKRIGDKYSVIDANGKITNHGNYPNISKQIRVADFKNMTEDNVFKFPVNVVPMGFEAVNNPTPGGTLVPAAVIKSNQLDANSTFDPNVFYGFDFGNTTSREYLAPIPNTATAGNNVSMSLENMNGNDNAGTDLGVSTFANGSTKISLTNSAIQQRKFMVPLQFGFDGKNPAIDSKTGANIVNTNTQGYDLSSAAASGSVAFKRAVNTISNPDEFDVNLIALPGVIHGLHSTVTNHVITKTEARADAFYVMDASGYSDTIETVKNTISTLDTNYASVYYPWVKLQDRDSSNQVWVPPSAVIPAVISFNDSTAFEWFAPAGLNRGGLTGIGVTQVKTRLTHAERDELYEARINPIASFPGQGVVVFGQKTLQSKPSALDRVNVRRLLINLRKFIASTTRFLVFEQNTQATRNRFLNIVNPYLNQVQSNSGLSAFRVVMDDSNNTPDVIDRNQLVGQIFIQPTRTAEFIVLDFIVQPTGASFPE